MAPIIEIKNISKQYRIGEAASMYGNLRETLTQVLRKPWTAMRNSLGNGNGGDKGNQNSFWALRDINFDVEKGDTIGIIGSNGAGKSTLLKILSRITDPTEGYVKIRGQIASLLEVGTGFHPELTGRENIYLNGAIMGMHKAEIDTRFDEIVGFAGISKFLDTPVKRYSSGMYVRLAFSIAAHLDPEILIVDEVLAVGDVAFQKKCLGKMAEACERARTVLFVSHNLAAVEALCTRVIVLQEGSVVFNGPSKEGVQRYLQGLPTIGSRSQSHIVDLSSAAGRAAKFHPVIKRLELYAGDDKPLVGEFATGSSLKVRIQFDLEVPAVSFNCGIAFETLSGQRICAAHSACEPNRVFEERVGEQTFVCDIPSLPLMPGEYKLCVGVNIGGDEVDLVDDATQLTVVKTDYFGTGYLPRTGVVLLNNRWTLEHQATEVKV